MSDLVGIAPLPPQHLRLRVAGTVNPRTFVGAGRWIARDVARLMKTHYGETDATTRVLDFGSGCGRVVSALRSARFAADLVCVDIDAEAVSWCRDAIPVAARFVVGPERPPLPFEAGTFDIIYAVSVFTHLPIEWQHLWLTELVRMLKPTGIAILTVYGARAAALLEPQQQEVLRREGVLYAADGGTAGLPSWYQSCFHVREHVEATWSAHGEILAYEEHAVLGSLDAVIMRPR